MWWGTPAKHAQNDTPGQTRWPSWPRPAGSEKTETNSKMSSIIPGSYYESTLPDILGGGVPQPDTPKRSRPLGDLGEPESKRNEPNSIILCFFTKSLRIDHTCFSFFWKGWWLCRPVLYWVCGAPLEGWASFFCWKEAPLYGWPCCW